MYIYIYMCVHIHIYACVCVCVFACVHMRGRPKKGSPGLSMSAPQNVWACPLRGQRLKCLRKGVTEREADRSFPDVLNQEHLEKKRIFLGFTETQ